MKLPALRRLKIFWIGFSQKSQTNRKGRKENLIIYLDIALNNQPSFESLGDLLPNSFHLGIGVEWVIVKDFKQFPKEIDLTVCSDYGLFFQNIRCQFFPYSV
jgi:hypothetical protein